MAFIGDYTGTLLDQLDQPRDQDESQSSHQSTFQDSYLHPKLTQWKSPTHSHESGTQDTSTQLLSPTLDSVNETASAINEKYPTPLRTNESSLFSFYSHALHGHNHRNQLLYSSFPTSPSYTQIGFNDNINNIINPVDRNSTFPSSSLNDNQYLNSDLISNNLASYGYENNDGNAAIWQAAQGKFGNYKTIKTNLNSSSIDNMSSMEDQSLPSSAPTQVLFQRCDPNLQNTPVDQALMNNNGPIRSPSPLSAVDDVATEETTSPELTEVQTRHRKRPCDGTPITQHPSLILSRALNHSLCVDTGGKRLSASHPDPEEKGRRAAAAEGLDKSDKRRMQNKFAQRAFRARNKITNKHAAGRLEHLEELAKQQVGWIGNLTELVERLQKENHALVTAKFQKEKTQYPSVGRHNG